MNKNQVVTLAKVMRHVLILMIYPRAKSPLILPSSLCVMGRDVWGRVHENVVMPPQQRRADYFSEGSTVRPAADLH